jgi:hypothetical protein
MLASTGLLFFVNAILGHYHSPRGLDGFAVFVSADGRSSAGITRVHCESSEACCLADGIAQLAGSLFQEDQQCGNIMNVGKLDPVLYEEALDGLFGCLLSVKAQIFKVNPFALSAGKREITACSAQPLARIL